MKFTVICLALLSISTTWASKATKSDEQKDKREAEVSYQSSVDHGQTYQAPSYSHGDASAVSIGAGYSIGGAKPSFSYGAPEGAEGLQSSGHSTVQLAPITLHASQGNVISGELSQFMSQLSHGLNSGAITLSPYQGGQSGHGEGISLSQLSYAAPSQQYQVQEPHSESSVPHYATGTKGLGSYSTGPALFQPSAAQHAQPSFTYSSPSSSHSFGGASGLSLGSGHGLSGLSLGEAGQSGHTIMFLSGAGHGAPAYAFGGSGLGGHSGISLGGHSGLTLGGHGPSALSLGSSGSPSYVSAGHSLGGSAGHSLGSGYSLGGHSLKSSGHSLGHSGLSFGSLGHSSGGPGYTLGGQSLGGSGHSFGGSGLSFGGSGHSFGGSLKGFGGHYMLPGKTSFKPSTYLGGHSDSAHGLSSLSGSYGSHGSPSFGSLSGHSISLSSGSHGLGGSGGHGLGSSGSHGASSFGGHGASLNGFGGSYSKLASSYLPAKSESEAGSYDSHAALSSHSHTHSPPATTYGIPQQSYSATASHSASSQSPQYYVSSKQPSTSHFGKGSSAYKAPSSGHSSYSTQSFSLGPKFSYSQGPSSRHSSSSSEDTHGAHSEAIYNTIKYSEEIKPHTH